MVPLHPPPPRERSYLDPVVSMPNRRRFSYWSFWLHNNYGNIKGSKGYLQEQLFYITDHLNITLEITESPGNMELLLQISTLVWKNQKSNFNFGTRVMLWNSHYLCLQFNTVYANRRCYDNIIFNPFIYE